MKREQALERLPLRPRGSSRDRKIQGLDVIIFVVLAIYAVLIIFPFWNAFIISISSEASYLKNNLLLWPTELDLSAYKQVFTNNQLWSGFGITMILLIGGTAYQLFFTVITGYAMSRNMLLMRNYFASLPAEMEESAKIDGANDLIIFVKIFLPLSLPMLATIGLFFAVGNWNSWYNAMLFIPDRTEIWPLQMVLRNMIATVSSNIENPEAVDGFSQGLTMASIFFTIVPMMCFYPFLQRFFVKGIVVGAIKG